MRFLGGFLVFIGKYPLARIMLYTRRDQQDSSGSFAGKILNDPKPNGGTSGRKPTPPDKEFKHEYTEYMESDPRDG